MAAAPGYLIDTNVLLRLFRKDDPQYQPIKAVLHELNWQSAGLYFSLQNIAEFWHVCTRPLERNGYGLSISETNYRVEELERTMSFLPDSLSVYSIWRRLVMDHNIRGVQVHDARLAAIMQAYGLNHILTLNQRDFLRFPGIQAVQPNQIQTSPR
jgi:predicted nucleic acid-binding protein